MVRDTFGDLRAAVWSNRQDSTYESSADVAAVALSKEIAALREQLMSDISRITATGPIPAELNTAVEEAIRSSVDAGLMARDEVVQQAILYQIDAAGDDGCVAASVVTAVGQQFPFGVVVRGLKDLRANGDLRWSGDLQPLSIVRRTA